MQPVGHARICQQLPREKHALAAEPRNDDFFMHLLSP
jgi:hypothetical protein